MVTELGRRGTPHSWVVYGEYGGLKATSHPVRPLSEAARRQVMCTVVSSAGTPADAEVTLVGPDAALAPDHCGFRATPARTRRPVAFRPLARHAPRPAP
ncbi:hypothetical protein ACFWBH_38515 [Streptomyces sp. NPDC059999]|uniref:hypothetical protein n=1 Tax=Streptomyces sp. NPDC059999 TaxID=3347030 RepID=UPI0036A47339